MLTTDGLARLSTLLRHLDAAIGHDVKDNEWSQHKHEFFYLTAFQDRVAVVDGHNELVGFVDAPLGDGEHQLVPATEQEREAYEVKNRRL